MVPRTRDVAPGIPEGSIGGGSAHNVFKMRFKFVPSVFNSAQNAFKVRSYCLVFAFKSARNAFKLRLSAFGMFLKC